MTYPVGIGNGVTRITECGSGDRVALLIHGIGSHTGWWDRNLEGLVRLGLHVYAVDLPGHGFAAATPGWDLTIPAYCEFVQRVQDEVVGGPLMLVGHSLGGHIAAIAALANPQAVRSMVLIAPTGITPMGRERLLATERRQSDVSREAIERKLRFATFDPDIVTETWIEQDFRINNGPGAAVSLRAIAAHLGNHLDDYVVGAQVASLAESVPTLLVWGREDRSVPLSEGRLARSSMPAATLAVIDGSAHVPHLEVPRAFSEIVASFLDNEEGDIEGVEWE